MTLTRLVSISILSLAFAACVVKEAPPPAQPAAGPGYAAPSEPAAEEPAPAPTGRRTLPPQQCTGNQALELIGVYIESGDTAVVLSGNCQVTIRDSEIKAAGIAIMISGNAEVTIEDSTIAGGTASIMVSGNAEIHAANSRFIGDRTVSGNAAVNDNGGNTW